MNLWFLLCSLGIGLNTAGKQSLRLAPLQAGLAEAMRCLPAGSLAGLPSCHDLSPGKVTCSRYKLSATGLMSQQLHRFTLMGDPGQGDCR